MSPPAPLPVEVLRSAPEGELLPVEIHRSAQQGDLQKVLKWLGNGGLVDALGMSPTRDGRATTETLLHAASGRGFLEMVKELLKHGAAIDLQSSLGLTALMAAACAGHLSIVLVLLQHLADTNLQDIHGQTALMWAVGLGQELCVRALLRAKANTELRDEDGRTPFLLAKAQGYTAIANLIRQHTAPAQPAQASPAAPPHPREPISLPVDVFHSAKRGELQSVLKWLGKGGTPNALCASLSEGTICSVSDWNAASGLALLHAASSSGQANLVRELLNRRASVDLPGRLGATPLMAAAGYGHLSTVHVLLEHSANPDLQCDGGYTALRLAEGHEECVQALLQAKANRLLNEDGRTALPAKSEHAAPPPPAAAAPAAPDDGAPTESSPASVPVEVFKSAERLLE